jgi:hypothetical protein
MIVILGLIPVIMAQLLLIMVSMVHAEPYAVLTPE